MDWMEIYIHGNLYIDSFQIPVFNFPVYIILSFSKSICLDSLFYLQLTLSTYFVPSFVFRSVFVIYMLTYAMHVCRFCIMYK